MRPSCDSSPGAIQYTARARHTVRISYVIWRDLAALPSHELHDIVARARLIIRVSSVKLVSLAAMTSNELGVTIARARGIVRFSYLIWSVELRWFRTYDIVV